MLDIDLSYIAGFFDGEGSITIHHNGRPSPRGLSPNHTLQVSIGNTDHRVLKWIHSSFGGSLVYRRSAKPNHRHVLVWVIRAALALPFLKAIRPFIRMKADQLDVAINFQENKVMRGPKRVTAQEVEKREKQRKEIQLLNKRVWIGDDLCNN